MADDAGRTLTLSVPESVADWLDGHGDDAETAAAELLIAQQSVATDPEASIEPAVASVLANRMDSITDAVIEHLESTDWAADDLEDRVGALESGQGPDPAHLRDRIGTLEDRVDDTERTVETRLDDLSEKVDRLAWIVVEERERVGSDPVLDRIRSAAHTADVDRAACEGCGRAIDLGLLGASTCPHCEAAFSDLDPPTGWFGSATLRLEEGTPDE
ncbi:hypothetical protein [Halococcoides cellulosivorans]|uniref:CopG family transcriptional regulator n=1 Tax=Halococcoides cellulosivorans TaxID=1679096 RepID=A0A2R4X333_9EURY|nr:hypothetical protein [Halococcoides cellulosivorans]AWB28205.1 hypothetical protein HARCEL1_11070 [Halococcoides cellulosivorans]